MLFAKKMLIMGNQAQKACEAALHPKNKKL